MNKLKLFLIAAIVFTSTAAMAQKIGYIKIDDVVGLMPEVGHIDTLLQRYQQDSVNTEYAQLVRDYKYRDSILNSKDTSTMPKSVKEQHQNAMQSLAYQIQNWQAISNQAVQAKQQELLDPVYRRIINAVQEVAKENGYTYVITQDAFLVAPPTDNLIFLVAKKLNLKLPPGVTPNGGVTTEKTKVEPNKTKTKTKG
jgi:outer membrane protein